MLLVALISLLGALSASAQVQDPFEECSSENFVMTQLDLINCGLPFFTANNTPATEAGMQAFDAICTAECAGAVARYLQSPVCNMPLEAAGLAAWCCPVEGAAISRCRYAFPDLLNATFLANVGLSCATSLTMQPPQCGDGCAEALGALSRQIGCCFQKLYNRTDEEIQVDIAAGLAMESDRALLQLIRENALWNVCGVDAPEVCSGNPFPETPTEESVTTEGAVHTAAAVLTLAASILLSLLL